MHLRLAALLLSTLALSGCGISSSLSSPSATSQMENLQGASIAGTVFGGPTPIQNANVILWQTTSSGYPSASNSTSGTTSIQLATTTTNSLGSFGFNPSSYTCASGQFVYITATGGDTGVGANNQSVQIAALGSCSNFDTDTHKGAIRIRMGELSTVAAAYALANFMYVVPSSTGNQLVYISAPANNNAATGACTQTSGIISTCVAAGLSHAFANAAILVDAVHYDGTAPGYGGTAYSTPPTNSTGVAPQALVNTLANILQYCTNTATDTGTNNPSTNCANLFTRTTPTTSSSNAATITAPTDELQALLNIVKNPQNNVSTLFGYSAAAGNIFQPTLTAAPHDFSVAIFYPSTVVSSTTTALGYPEYVALDANDNVFVLAADAATPTKSGIAGFASNGTSLFAPPFNTNYCFPGQIATDNVGNVWLTNNSSTTNTTPCVVSGTATQATYSLAAFSTTTGAAGTVFNSASSPAVSSTPYGIAFNRNNDLWYSRVSGSCTQCLYFFKYTAGTYANNTFTTNPVNVYGASITIDANQNVWLASQPSSSAGTNGNLVVLPNQSTVASPAYGKTDVLASVAMPNYAGYGVAIDAAGKAWAASRTNLSYTTPTYGTQAAYSVTKYYISGNQAYLYYSGTYPGVGQSLTLSGFATSTFFNSQTVIVNTVSTGSGYFRVAFTHTSVGSSGSPITETGSATPPNDVTSLSAFTNTTTTANSPGQMQFDGLGTLWYPSTTTTGSIFYYVPANGTNPNINPCYLPSAATTCAATSGTGSVQSAQIDSTGSLWLAAPGSSSLVQVIGVASPVWPQLSYSVPATLPQ